MIFTRVLNLSNVAFLANLFRFKDGFSKLQMISNTKAFPYIFLRFSSPSSVTLNLAISVFFTQLVIFSIFSSALRLDDLPQADLSIRPVYQIRPRSDRHTRPPGQITPPDHRLLSFQSSQHTQPLEMVQVRCIPYGLGEGGYIELWMNLAKHTFHTLSAWIFRTFFSA